MAKNLDDTQILRTAVNALDDKKGDELKLIKIADVSSLANYFLIATGNSSTHVKTLADEVEAKLKAQGEMPRRTEGYRGADWIILDYASVIVHVFYKETREFYDLERLWEEGEEVDISAFLK
ncbi:MAG: ribosome silencing factor [Oscillospiraceae bacterium]|nr:ribosome silencing factor [Oscillospiraceae bacterium]